MEELDFLPRRFDIQASTRLFEVDPIDFCIRECVVEHRFFATDSSLYDPEYLAFLVTAGERKPSSRFAFDITIQFWSVLTKHNKPTHRIELIVDNRIWKSAGLRQRGILGYQGLSLEDLRLVSFEKRFELGPLSWTTHEYQRKWSNTRGCFLPLEDSLKSLEKQGLAQFDHFRSLAQERYGQRDPLRLGKENIKRVYEEDYARQFTPF